MSVKGNISLSKENVSYNVDIRRQAPSSNNTEIPPPWNKYGAFIIYYWQTPLCSAGTRLR